MKKQSKKNKLIFFSLCLLFVVFKIRFKTINDDECAFPLPNPSFFATTSRPRPKRRRPQVQLISWIVYRFRVDKSYEHG